MNLTKLRWSGSRSELQRNMLLGLSTRLMARRCPHATGALARFAQQQISIAYPERLFDALVRLAHDQWGPLRDLSNLHEVLVTARDVQMQLPEPSLNVWLRSHLWLHVQLALAAIGDLEHCRKLDDPDFETRQNLRFQIDVIAVDVGYVLVQIAEACDQSPGLQTAEMVHSMGSCYMRKEF